MSIFDDMVEIKRLADEITGKADKLVTKLKYAPHGRCDDCGTPLEYEAPFAGAPDQPPSAGGFWCPECENWS